MLSQLQKFRTTLGRVMSALALTVAAVSGAQAQVVNNPPAAPISLTAFPHRSFVSATGYDFADRVVVRVTHPNGTVVSTDPAAPITPTVDPGTGTGLVEVNHPGGACWFGVTPDIRVGDVVSISIVGGPRAGRTDATTVRDMFVARPLQPVPGRIEIHGTARDPLGNPLPIADISVRVVSLGAPFSVNNTRSLRADGLGAGDGTLTYDAPGSAAFTAVFTGLSPVDVTNVFGGEIVAGYANAALTEGTLYEIGPGLFPGPAAPCTAPLEVLPPPPGSELIPPSVPAGLRGSVTSFNIVNLTWSPSTDNVGVTAYGIYRNGVRIALVESPDGVTPPATSYVDANLAPGTYSYTVDAADAVGNRSAVSLAVSATAVARPAANVIAHEPPLAPISIIAFPSRDFVSSTGWLATDRVTFEIIRDGRVISTASGVVPQAGGLAEANHPGGACWEGVTPELRMRDLVRLTANDPTGAVRTVEQTHVSAVTVQRAVALVADNPATLAGEGVVVVRGTAVGPDGKPIPVDQLEQRVISPGNLFLKNRKRALRAGAAPLDGILTYDAIDPVTNPLGFNWTATYTGLVGDDVARATGGISNTTGTLFPVAEYVGMWLGVNPATVAEGTIYENSDANLPGPSAPLCTAFIETPDTTAPSKVGQLQLTRLAGNAVTLTWLPSVDDWSVSFYRIARDGVILAMLPAINNTWSDLTPPPGVHTYEIVAFDKASARGAGVDFVAQIAAGFGRMYGNMSPRDTISAPRDYSPPTVPTNLVVVSKPGQAQLSWTASTDNVAVTSYRVYRSGVAVGNVIAPATSFVDVIATSGVYTYTVDAADAAGNRSAQSLGVTSLVRIPADIIPPGAPTLAAPVVTSNLVNGSVALSWTPAVDLVNETGYAIYRNGVLIDSVLVPTTTYTQANIPFGAYTYQVDAYDAPFNHGAKSAAVTANVVPPIPAAPTALKHVVTSTTANGSLTLSWTPGVDFVNETGYGIYRNGVLVDSVAAPATSYALTGVAFGTYLYQVDAYVAGVGARGALSAIDTIVVAPPPAPGAPTALKHVVTSTTVNGSLTLSWTPAVDQVAETSYGIYRNGVLVDSVAAPATSYALSGVAFGTYLYQVDATVLGLVRGARSAVDTVVVAPPVAPGAPTALRHTITATQANGSVTLSWTPAVDLVNESGYGIYRNGVLIDSVAAPATSYTQAVAFGTYLYQVDAYVSGLVRGALSAVDTAIVVAPPVPLPGAPTLAAPVVTTTATNGTVALSWTPAADGIAKTGYGIYRNGVLVDSVLATATTYSQVVAFGTYTYQVDAYVSSLVRGAKSALVTAVVTAPLPGAPTLAAPVVTTTATNGTVALSWTPAADGIAKKGFGIYRNGVLVDSVLATVTTYSQVVAFGTYTYQVDAYVSSLVRGAKSALVTATVTAPPPPPAVVVAAPGIPSSAIAAGNMTVSAATIANSTLPVNIAWAASATAGVTRYQVQLSLNSTPWVNVTTATPLSLNLAQALALGGTTATTSRSYQYRVRAFVGADSSAWAIGQRFGLTAADNASASITYVGTWTLNTGVTGAYGGSTRSATVATASATFRSAILSAPGTLALISSKGPTRGRVLISVDGGAAVTVDLYAATTQQAAVVFTAPVASGVAHTMRVAPAGTRNALSTSNRVDVDAFMVLNGAAGATPAALQQADGELAPVFHELSFAPINPNPSRGQAALSFALPRDGAVELGIVDVQGRQIINLHQGVMAAGPHQMVWDGRSSAGSQSAPGVYFAVLRFENTTLTKRIVRVP